MKNKRDGNSRKKRGSRKGWLKEDKPYYLIVTDTDATEKNFFTRFRENLPDDVKNKVTIKVVDSIKTENLIDKCMELLRNSPQVRQACIVFDRDEVANFDQMIRTAKKKGILVAWSNPCFEIWLFAYFNKMPNIERSKVCCSDFGNLFKEKTGMEYKKGAKKIYDLLIKYGDEKQAIEIATQRYNQKKKDYKLPSQMTACTTVHELIKKILGNS